MNKSGRKPTLKEKVLMSNNDYLPTAYLVIRHNANVLEIVSKKRGTIHIIKKG